MAESFTDAAKRAMADANVQANRYGHKFILADHMLLGICLNGKSSGATLLRNHRVDLTSLKQQIQEHIRTLQADTPPEANFAKPVIEMAVDEARALKATQIATHHMILGMLRCPQTQAAKFLIAWGITLAGLRIDASHAPLN